MKLTTITTSPTLVNKLALADDLDISLKTLNLWISRNDDFPIVARGGQGDEYQFDLDAVRTWVTHKKAREAAAKDKETTPNARKTLAQARLFELEIQEKLGELVEVAEVEDLLAALMLGLAHQFEEIVPRLKHELGVDHATCVAIRAWLDGYRVEMARKIKDLVTK